MYSLAATATTVSTAPSAAAQAAIAALAALPCWSDQAHACVDTAGPSSLPNCATIRSAYARPSATDKAALDAAVEAVPFCPAPSALGDWRIWVGAGALGFAAGLFVSALRK